MDFINYFFQPQPGLSRHTTARYGILISKVTGKVFLLTLKLLLWSIPACGSSSMGRTQLSHHHPQDLVFLVVEPFVNCVGQKKRRGLVPCEPPSYQVVTWQCVCVPSSSGASSLLAPAPQHSKQVLAHTCLCGSVLPKKSPFLLGLPSGASMIWCRQGQQARPPSGSAGSGRQSHLTSSFHAHMEDMHFSTGLLPMKGLGVAT